MSKIKYTLFTLLFIIVLPLGQLIAVPEPEIMIIPAVDRDIQVWHWEPEESKGVIIFSHGASSAPWKYTSLINSWVNEGYEVAAPLHVDSSDHPRSREFAGMAGWTARLEDMQILADRFGGNGYIAAGHSYGGLTALVKGGASALVPEGVKEPVADPRVKLVLAFSPPGTIPGFVDDYGTLNTPALILTGTADMPTGADNNWEGHLDAYMAAEADGSHYALILDDVDHYFGGAICRPEREGPQQLEQLAKASDFSLLMLKAYQQNDEESLQELNGLVGEHADYRFTRR